MFESFANCSRDEFAAEVLFDPLELLDPLELFVLFPARLSKTYLRCVQGQSYQRTHPMRPSHAHLPTL